MKIGIYCTFRMDDPFLREGECFFFILWISPKSGCNTISSPVCQSFWCRSSHESKFGRGHTLHKHEEVGKVKEECFLNIWINLNCGRLLPNMYLNFPPDHYIRLWNTCNPYLNNVKENSHLFCSHSISRYAKYYEHPRQVIKNASRTGIFTNIGESISHW